jgi:hypothetical protein
MMTAPAGVGFPQKNTKSKVDEYVWMRMRMQ